MTAAGSLADESGAYLEDLAYIHHVGHSDFARDGADGVLDELARAGVEGGRLLEIGCGTGVFAALATARGYDVTGFDLSPEMIAYARREAPGATFHVGSFVDHPLEPCDAVVALGEVLNYRLDPRHDRRGLRRTLRRIHDALRPGGAVVFDVCGPGRQKRRGPLYHVLEDDWACCLHAIEDERKRTLERRITAFRLVGRAWRRSDEVHRLKLFAPAEVLAEMRAVGFRARSLAGFGAVRFERGTRGFVGRKPR